MVNFILRRIAQTVVVIIILSYICFGLMSLMPGDPVELMISANPKITAEDVQRLRDFYGLDQPIYKRYFNWVSDIAKGDLGYSRTYRIPVTEMMGPALTATFTLSMTSLVFSLLIAVPIGILCALKPNTKLDYFVNLFSFAGISVPSFWLGIVLIIVFAVNLNVLPAGGYQTTGMRYDGFFDELMDKAKYLILPVLSLSILSIGRFARFTRSSMMEAMRNDFIRTAKAKGLSSQTVIWRHGFRNALIPLITVVALSLSSIFSGALITETLFAYPGAGRLIYSSIMANDFNVAMVSFIISVSMVLIMNLIADILYGVVDPRVSFK
ncbi:ABC transporter permease [Pseudobdellovibrio exovorus]|uniref:Dipeptide transport system permease protein DppB n=1 Tax=Pseudobdellovibrio exovorus JSS TaxID=1184267 RepID=M4VR22_9BACT|nr:ABC transporter permease [Pseudobdellovibrio exovorus]AGH95619.1 dipeptide transport system permease protein DppB [Pseudobdellovibrio exovorus JSS]